jgi:hypothetical protein
METAIPSPAMKARTGSGRTIFRLGPGRRKPIRLATSTAVAMPAVRWDFAEAVEALTIATMPPRQGVPPQPGRRANPSIGLSNRGLNSYLRDWGSVHPMILETTIKQTIPIQRQHRGGGHPRFLFRDPSCIIMRATSVRLVSAPPTLPIPESVHYNESFPGWSYLP